MCKISQVYYLTFMCGSTCFGRLSAHYQERTNALRASGFTVGEWRLERCWSCSARRNDVSERPAASRMPLKMKASFLLNVGTFEVCKSVYHHTIQINQPTRCKSFTSLLLDVYVWLNMFHAPLRPSSGAYKCTKSLWFYRWRVAVEALLVVVWQTTTNNAPTATLQR
jgi:hypothetical protein